MNGLIKFLQKYIRLETISYSHDVFGGKEVRIVMSLYFKDILISTSQTVTRI